MNLEFLNKKENELIEELRKIKDVLENEKRSFNNEERELFNSKSAELKQIRSDIEALKVDLINNTPTTTSNPTKKESAFRNFLKNGEVRDLSVSNTGGVSVPKNILEPMFDKTNTTHLFQNVFGFEITTNSEVLNIPYFNPGAPALTIEELESSTGDTSMTGVELGAKTYTSGTLSISRKLIQDSAFDVEKYILENGLTKLQRGIFKASLTQLTGSTSVSGATTANGILALYTSIDEAYKNSDKCYWIMNNSHLTTILNIVNSDKIHQLQFRQDENGNFWMLGRRVIISDYATKIFFGDMGALIGRYLENAIIYRTINGDRDSVEYNMFLDADMKLADTNAVKNIG